MAIQTLHDSPRYKTFINDRNRALERINQNTQADISSIMKPALHTITGLVSYMGIQEHLTLSALNPKLHVLDLQISTLFEDTRNRIVARVMRARKATFILTYMSELEAIARATKKTKVLDPRLFAQKLKIQVEADTLTGTQLDKSIWFSLSKLKRKILDACQRGVIMEESPKEIVDRVEKAYPPLVEYKRAPRSLKPIREADKKREDDEEEGKEFDFYHDVVTDEDWDFATKAYTDTEMPQDRTGTSIYSDESGVRKYEWEVEQEVTDDFVQQVRDGQVEAANDLGVKDFVWVAVIDKKTCEVCCMPRAGKLTSEIKEMLISGELDKTECDAVTPPAHPFCRCDIAPVASSDPVEGPDWKSFDEWLSA